MRYIRKLSTIGLFLLLVCLSSAKADSTDYFPLQVGNTWIFDLYEWPNLFVMQDTISIIDSLKIDDKTWFLFNRYFTIHRLEDSVYLRKEEDKVYRYQKGREELWFDFAANEGDSWQVRIFFAPEDTLVPVTVKLIKKSFDFSLNNRAFENGCNFEFVLGADYGWTYTLVPKFGCVFSGVISIWPRDFRFRNGSIDGIVYPDLVTSVESKNKHQQDSINQTVVSIFPNPFNSSTRIAIDARTVQGNLESEIIIYDIRGRIVKTFSIAPKIAPQISWNGENDSGTLVPSGIYFVGVRLDNKYLTKKVTFVRSYSSTG